MFVYRIGVVKVPFFMSQLSDVFREKNPRLFLTTEYLNNGGNFGGTFHIRGMESIYEATLTVKGCLPLAPTSPPLLEVRL
jgi:hypothetical protein